MKAKLLPKIKCQNPSCGIYFHPKRSWQKYHDKSCKDAMGRWLRPPSLEAIKKDLEEVFRKTTQDIMTLLASPEKNQNEKEGRTR